VSAPDPLDPYLFPNGVPTSEKELDRLFELYKIMVASSEALVARRQGVNTFFLTINGALLTAIGLVLSNGDNQRLQAAGMLCLTATGALLCGAWTSLIRSFGQLNTGKFAVIGRIEKIFPGSIFDAEWKALGEGKDPTIYRPFTKREVWTPKTLLLVYGVATLLELAVVFRWWTPS
jgi:hypothetical protein